MCDIPKIKPITVKILLAIAACALMLIGKLYPEKRLFWVAVVLGVLVAIGQIIQMITESRRKKEICITKETKDWIIEPETNYRNTRLEITPKEHGKGDNIKVDLKCLGQRTWDFEKPEIEKGMVTIRFASNNYPFPLSPNIVLEIYISAK